MLLGGGNEKELKDLPPKCRTGDNHNPFIRGLSFVGEIECATIDDSYFR